MSDFPCPKMKDCLNSVPECKSAGKQITLHYVCYMGKPKYLTCKEPDEYGECHSCMVQRERGYATVGETHK